LILASGHWQIDLGRRELRARGMPVPIGGRAFEILEVLARASGGVITKEAIMKRVWPGAVVEENTLQVHILAVRAAFGADRDMLKTVYGKGYRLVGDWVWREDEATDAERPAQQASETPLSPLASGRLPLANAPLIGRDGAVQQVCDLVSAYRLVSLVGAGGIGKTKLALQAARAASASFAHGAWLVELASLGDANLVSSAVAAALGLELGSHRITAASVAAALGEREILLVLDNAEHLVAAVAEVAETLLRGCPRLTILTTSREPLQCEGERTFRVPPLDVPPADGLDPSTLPQVSAVRMFLACMTAADPSFAPDEQELITIGAICRRLDGIPLAIEFAAARATMLGPATVLSRLNERFGLLTSGRRLALPQHRTLRATLDWSYDLLPDPEKRLFRFLGIFPGSFTLDAAAAVASGGDEAAAASAFEDISQLAAKSLLSRDATGQNDRWRLLETTRAYAHGKLVECGELNQAARRHAAFFRDLLRPALAEQPSGEALRAFGFEIDNLRSALDWAFSAQGDIATAVFLTAGFVPVWLQRFLISECGGRVEQALEAVDRMPPAGALDTARLLTMLGFALLNTSGQAGRTRMVLTRALALAEDLRDSGLLLRILWAHWSLNFNAGDYRTARPVAERFLSIAEGRGDAEGVTVGHRLLGSTLHFTGDQKEAQRHLEFALRGGDGPAGAVRPIWFLLDQRIVARAMLARVLAVQGQMGRAAAEAQMSLEDAQAADHQLSVCYTLRNAVCPICLMRGDIPGATRTVMLLKSVVERNGMAFWLSWAASLQGQLLVEQGECASGIDLLRSAIAERSQAGWHMRAPEFMAVLAQGLAKLNRHQEALDVLEQALALSAEGGQCWYWPELLRLKAECILAQTADWPTAEALLREAIKTARAQGAALWELRAALSLTRAAKEQPEILAAAKAALAEICSLLGPDDDGADLRSAKAILWLD